MTDQTETTHEHAFDNAPYPKGTIVWCDGFPECSEMRVVGKRGGLRELTAQERVGVLAHMMQATAIAQAMIMIHGREKGIARARQVLGYA